MQKRILSSTPNEAESAKLYNLLIQSLSDYAIFAVDLQGTITSWSPGVKRVLNYDEHEFVGQPFAILFTPADVLAGAHTEEMTTAHRTGRSADQRWHVRNDNARIFVDGVLTAINDDGHVIGYSKIMRDDTSRKRIEEEREQLLAEVTARAAELDAIFASISDGLYVGTREGIHKCNEPALQMLGFTHQDQINRSVDQLSEELDNRLYATGEKLTPEREPFVRALNGEHAVEEVSLRNVSTGQRLVVRSAASPIWRDGTVAGAVAINTDITSYLALLESEQSARRTAEISEKNYRFLAESIPEIIWTTAPQGTSLYYNRRWLEFTMLDSGPHVSNPWQELVDPKFLDACLERWNFCLESGRTFEMELPFIRHDGVRLWHLCRALPQRDKHGTILGWTGICTDIDGRKRSEQALIQTAKLESIGVLAGGIAHDFNNLLTGILGNTGLAMDLLPSAHPAARLLDDVTRASESAAHLTRQLLAYAGKGRFTLEQVQLARLIPQTVDLIKTSIPPSVSLRLRMGTDLPPVEADASQIQQIVMNLVLNAAESIPERTEGWVVISTSVRQIDTPSMSDGINTFPLEPGLFVSFTVQDSGVGMSFETLSKIFDPFFTTKFTGRGLGLAAVSGIARSHKGAILVQSEPGRGSTFHVLLPASGAGLADAALPGGGVRTRVPRGTVLVVDDLPIIRRVAQNALAASGFAVLLAESGEHAIEIFSGRSGEISAVLLDLTMPGMTGLETMRRLRDLDPKVRVVLSSGFDQADAVSRFEGLPLDGFLQKPYTVKALVEQIEAVL